MESTVSSVPSDETKMWGRFFVVYFGIMVVSGIVSRILPLMFIRDEVMCAKMQSLLGPTFFVIAFLAFYAFWLFSPRVKKSRMQIATLIVLALGTIFSSISGIANYYLLMGKLDITLLPYYLT